MSARATIQANTESDWTIIRRLLALSWRYRLGCIKVFIYQLILLAMGLAGLGLTGLGVDFVRWQIQTTVSPVAPPHWPFGLVPPAAWPPMRVLVLLAAIMFTFAILRAVLN